MVKVSEEEKNAVLKKLKELIKNKKEMGKVKVFTGISYISMNKNLISRSKTKRKTLKVLQRV